MNKKWLLLALGTLVVLAGVYQFWYSDVQDKKQDEQKFQQIEETVSTLVSRAENEFSELNFENKNYCYYQSRKFEDPNLACVVSNTFESSATKAAEIYDFMVEQPDLVHEGTNRNVRENDFLGRFTLINKTPCLITSDQAEGVYEIDCISDAVKAHYDIR